jgi:hypothetical protein
MRPAAGQLAGRPAHAPGSRTRVRPCQRHRTAAIRQNGGIARAETECLITGSSRHQVA